MKKVTVTTRVEEEYLYEIDNISKTKHIDRATLVRNYIVQALLEDRKERVLEEYKKRKISLELAAKKLGMSIWDIIDIVKERGLYIDYTKEELEEDTR